MAITELTKRAKEKSTYMVNVAFKDEDDAAVTPNVGTVVWTLSDKYGNPVNSLEDQAEASAATVTIVMSALDLQVLSNERTFPEVERRLTVYAEYDSDEGTDLPIIDSCKFFIRNLRYIS